MADLSLWLRDELMELIGFTNSNIEGYLLSLARSSLSFTNMLNSLEAANDRTFNIHDERTRGFLKKLFDRVPKPEARPIVHQEVVHSTISMDRRDDDEDDDRTGKKRKRQLRQRFEDGNEEGVPVEEEYQPTIKRRKLEIEESMRKEEEERARMEEERSKQELKDFESKMLMTYETEKERDSQATLDQKTERVPPPPATPTSTSKTKDGEKLSIDERRHRMIENLRNASRQSYLKDHERKKLELLRAELEAEKSMFSDEELTEKELSYRKMMEDILELVKRRDERGVDTEHYSMPKPYFDPESRVADQKRRFDLLQHQKEDGDKSQKRKKVGWETQQMKKAQIGSAPQLKRRRRKKSPSSTELDTILLDEERIEFIAEGILEGTFRPDSETIKKLGITEEALKIASTTTSNTEVRQPPRQLTESERRYRDARSEIKKTKLSLPIYAYRDKILSTLASNQVVIIVGETGSGKTTQLPQYLYESGYCQNEKIVGCTQPRRVAAMSVAARVCIEMGVKLGEEVGYSIRFEERTSPSTRLKYMTDGMLLREFLSAPDLAPYSCMMIDEAHERSLHTDILFALVKDVVRFRKDFRLIISSATLQSKKFSEYFFNAPILNIPGRTYNVDVMYTKAPEHDYLEAAVVTVLQIHITQPRGGDVLVFLTGQEEIETMNELLLERVRPLGTKVDELLVVPIFGNLPAEQQVRIFQNTPPKCRKVVLATNIAETSLTIPNIVYVVDTGFVKQSSFNPKNNMSSLLVTPISKQNAKQRAGRAGRTRPGKCFRLYTRYSHEKQLPNAQIPEVQRTNLASVVLTLKSLGINNLIEFDFVDPPPAETLIASLELLYALGGLNEKGELTVMGRKMAEFPLDPRLAKTLVVAAEQYGCALEVAKICAMLTINTTIFFSTKEKRVQAELARKTFAHELGDHLMLLDIYNQWEETDYSSTWCFRNFIKVRALRRARDIKDQLVGLLQRIDAELSSDPLNSHGILKSFAAGFFFNTAVLTKSGEYRTHHRPQIVHMHPTCCLYEKTPKWAFFHELMYTTREFMRQVSEIQPEWLIEIAPHIYKEKQKRKILANKRKMPRSVGRSRMAI